MRGAVRKLNFNAKVFAPNCFGDATATPAPMEFPIIGPAQHMLGLGDVESDAASEPIPTA